MRRTQLEKYCINCGNGRQIYAQYLAKRGTRWAELGLVREMRCPPFRRPMGGTHQPVSSSHLSTASASSAKRMKPSRRFLPIGA